MAETTARLVHYAGRVQGVGFRATAAHLARRYPVVGWVRNLSDGRVQLLAEGSPDAIEAFLTAVRFQFGGFIEREQTEERTPTGRLTSFEITR
jgi:acylphosphatase